jgi:hypothetical protein
MTSHSEEVKRIFETLGEEEMKKIAEVAFKTAMKEWLDDQFKKFGRFAFWSVASLLLTSIIFFILKMHGWTLRP